MIKAFTMIEIIVAMLIASLVIGGGYRGYILVQKSVLNYERGQQEVSEDYQFYGAFHYDFMKARHVFVKGSEIHCVSDSSTVVYEMDDQLFTRKDGHSVFSWETDEYDESFLLGEEKVIQGLTDHIQFEWESPTWEDHRWEFKKEYGKKIYLDNQLKQDVY